jgi:putative colanic acid biosysnthesis UDP-glucose lipid carrier transferase
MSLKSEAASLGVPRVAFADAKETIRSTAVPQSDSPALRETLASVSPLLLTEVQAALMPVMVIVSGLLAHFAYIVTVLKAPTPFELHFGGSLLGAVIIAGMASILRLHETADIIAGKMQTRATIAAISLGFLFLIGFFYLFKISDQYSRGWLGIWYSLCVVTVLMQRTGVLIWARLLKAERRLLQRTAIYGDVDLAEKVFEKLMARDGNFVLAGMYTDRTGSPSSLREARNTALRVQGGMEALIASAQTGACDRVILALRAADRDTLSEAMAQLDVVPIDVKLSPDAMTMPVRTPKGEELAELVLLDVQQNPMAKRSILAKAVLDYGVGLLATIAAAPIMLLVALAIRMEGAGPIFFIQRRHGYNNQIIRVVKFRTMKVAEDGAVVTQATKNDSRVTKVGRFLRKSSLDELPQLFNVLKGEMSLVGPRPHAITHNEAYTNILDRYATRHKVKPGITGWAQVNGFRGETKNLEAMCGRLEHDLYYIKNWSTWLDFKILLKTLTVPFASANAY